jgi:hypothetical protein
MIALPPHPERLRSRRHLARLRLLPCCIPGCRGWPVDAHHLKCGPERGGTVRASDNFAVPLCRWTHHTAASRAGVHAAGNEAAWWRAHNLDPLVIASRLWAESETPF